MKRDMDLIRKILLAMEEKPDGFFEGRLVIDGYSSNQIGYHVYLMMQAGLVEGADATTMDSSSPVAIPTCLTWYGHDFLDASRDENRWTKAKQMAAKLGSGVTFDVMKTLLVQIMTSQIPTLIASGV